MVDNGSTDGSVDRWDERHPDVTLIRIGPNLGYAGGVNRGLADLEGVDAVALVNSDAFVEPGWLRPLAAALDSDGAARRRLAQDPLRRRGAAGGGADQQRGQRARGTTGRHTTAGSARRTAGQYDHEEDVWGWCGAARAAPPPLPRGRGSLRRAALHVRRGRRSSAGAGRGGVGGTGTCRPRSCGTSTGPASEGERTPRLDYLNRRNRLVVVTRHGGLRGRRRACGPRALGGIVVGRLGPTCSLPCSGRAARRRVRGAGGFGRPSTRCACCPAGTPGCPVEGRPSAAH